jgi:hypothetical protein
MKTKQKAVKTSDKVITAYPKDAGPFLLDTRNDKY